VHFLAAWINPSDDDNNNITVCSDMGVLEGLIDGARIVSELGMDIGAVEEALTNHPDRLCDAGGEDLSEELNDLLYRSAQRMGTCE
jgi:hypothetical protein